MQAKPSSDPLFSWLDHRAAGVLLPRMSLLIRDAVVVTMNDRLEIVRRQPFDEAIHLLTPGPERIGLGAAPFREPRHGALKRVAVQIGQARNLAGGEVQLCGHDKACTVSGEIC